VRVFVCVVVCVCVCTRLSERCVVRCSALTQYPALWRASKQPATGLSSALVSFVFLTLVCVCGRSNSRQLCVCGGSNGRQLCVCGGCNSMQSCVCACVCVCVRVYVCVCVCVCGCGRGNWQITGKIYISLDVLCMITCPMHAHV